MNRVRGGLLLGAALTALFLGSAGSALAAEEQGDVQPGPPQALVFLVPDASLADLLNVPSIRALARAGGAGLVSASGGPLGSVLGTQLPQDISRPSGVGLPNGATYLMPSSSGEHGSAALDTDIPKAVESTAPSQALVIVTAPSLSEGMQDQKSELTPIVLAQGNPSALFPAAGPLHALSSASTRRTGIVTADDVARAIHDFGNGPGAEPAGSQIDVVNAPPPLHLYEKHLANRRMSVPIQAGAAIYVGLAGLLGVAVLSFRRRTPRWLKLVAAWAAMSVPALAVALLAAGRLPTLSYGTVVPFLVVGAVTGTVAFHPLRRRDVLLMPAAVGAAVLIYFVVEAIFNWSAALTPFLGGSELDGGRFFGLPNVYVGLLLGASLYVAQRLSLWLGVALIVAVGLFAGLPGIGANLGGALTLFSAGGMWLIVRAHDDLGWGRTIAIAAAIVVVGMAAMFASHVFLTATPTHGTRFVEGAGRSASGVWDTITHRLGVGFDLIARNPFALLPVLGVPACLYIVLRPPSSIRDSFERHPVWRDALLVILLGSIVAYAVNDSGAAAVGLGFGLALGGMLYVPLSEEAGNMEAA